MRSFYVRGTDWLPGLQTFVVRRGDLAKLTESALASSSVFKQTLSQCMIGQGDGYGFKGYQLVFVLQYLQDRGMWLGSEYRTAEQAMSSIATVGGYVMTPAAFSNVDDLHPGRHDAVDIDWAIAQLDVKVPDAGSDGLIWLEILWEKMTALTDDQALLILVG